jgi:hypothetical protein
MTTLGRPVSRETAVCLGGRRLIVGLHAGYLTLRRKGTGHTVLLDYHTAWEVAHKILARQAALERKAK